MALISPAALLRAHPRAVLRIPPYLSFLCILIGVAWLLLLPLNDYSRQTYISENALLPGQVHTYFGGSEQNVFRAYKREVDALAELDDQILINDGVEKIFKENGLKVGRQKYEYTSSGIKHAGENVYAILHAPRGDATEAVVLAAAWKNMDGLLNQRGVPLVLTLARYFKRWSLWSKDIIFLITADSKAGPQAWVDAYHDTHSPHVASLSIKSGALQGAVVIDYPFDHNFESLHVVYDGVNGQLPNLDLFNTVVSIASGQMGIGANLQKMWQHTDSYKDRLTTMLRGMLNQGLGHASGPHSSFIPYHVDAITLQPFGEGWQDEMAMGRVIESTFRSLNNLLEHLHQSFFFYLLMQANRFVSIGTYLPSAMLVAVNFTIMAILLWVKSGRPQVTKAAIASTGLAEKKASPLVLVEKDGAKALVPEQSLAIIERELFLPLAVVIGAQFLGLVPLYIFNNTPESMLYKVFIGFTITNTILPFLTSEFLIRTFHPTTQHYTLLTSFSLLILGMFLSSLATLNFSLALIIGLLSAPLSFVRPAGSLGLGLALSALTPNAVLWVGSWYWDVGVVELLREAAFGWWVWGMRTGVVVWCVWWPAWLVGVVVVWGRPSS